MLKSFLPVVVGVEYYPYRHLGQGVHTVIRMDRHGAYMGTHINGVHSASVWMIPTQEVFDKLSEPEGM